MQMPMSTGFAREQPLREDDDRDPKPLPGGDPLAEEEHARNGGDEWREVFEKAQTGEGQPLLRRVPPEEGDAGRKGGQEEDAPPFEARARDCDAVAGRNLPDDQPQPAEENRPPRSWRHLPSEDPDTEHGGIRWKDRVGEKSRRGVEDGGAPGAVAA